MSKTNCPNCGAALDIFKSKCEFCGTKNINMTDIDLASGEAANFIFRLPHNITDANGQEVYMSMLAIPKLDTIEMVSEPISIYSSLGNAPLCTYKHETNLQMGLTLDAVPRKVQEKDTLCTLSYKD